MVAILESIGVVIGGVADIQKIHSAFREANEIGRNVCEGVVEAGAEEEGRNQHRCRIMIHNHIKQYHPYFNPNFKSKIKFKRFAKMNLKQANKKMSSEISQISTSPHTRRNHTLTLPQNQIQMLGPLPRPPLITSQQNAL